MLLIGLTGGIGSGKSTACDCFRQLGVPVIDTDEIAHQLVRPGSPVLQQLVQLFGEQVLMADGSLNRTLLRERVFRDGQERARLEALLHPLIRQEMQRQIAQLSAPYVILAIPLLLEKRWQDQIDRVLVIDCSETLQKTRAGLRDGSSPQTIERIIASQVDRETRVNAADDLIDNAGSIDSLRQQVDTLHRRYLAISAKRNN